MFFSKKLAKAKAYRYREAQALDSAIDFASNDYLGYAKMRKLCKPNVAFTDNTRSSRLLYGQHQLLSQTEEALAKHFNFEAALLVPSGYQANVGLVSSLSGLGVNLYYDEAIHASTHDGMRLGQNHKHLYKHNQWADLESALNQYAQSAELNVILTEALFSMDGDFANKEAVCQLAKKHNASIIIDEAHSSGTFGENGAGLWDYSPEILAKVVTLGKAFGVDGAAILCSQALREYLLQYCRAIIFSTAPSANLCQQVLDALQWTKRATAERQQLEKNVEHFCKQLHPKFFEQQQCPSAASSPVQVIISQSDKLLQLEKKCHENNMALKAIFAPSVPRGKERIRISIHAFNKTEDIDKLCSLINTHL